MAAAEQVLHSKTEVEDLIQQRATKRTFDQRDDQETTRTLPKVALPPLDAAGMGPSNPQRTCMQTPLLTAYPNGDNQSSGAEFALPARPRADDGERTETAPEQDWSSSLADGAVDIVMLAMEANRNSDETRRQVRQCGDTRTTLRTSSDGARRDVEMGTTDRPRAISLDRRREQVQRAPRTPRDEGEGRREKAHRERTPRGRTSAEDAQATRCAREYRRLATRAGSPIVLG